MGNCFESTSMQVVESIQQLQAVERTLGSLIEKYDAQIARERDKAKQHVHSKSDCMVHIRIIRLLRHHRQQLQQRCTNCMEKRYQLESLNVTSQHIKAVRATSKTFKKFLKQNDLKRVEDLQDTLTEMIQEACDIQDTLQEESQPLLIDDQDIEDEYAELCAEVHLPEAPTNEPIKVFDMKLAVA